MSNPRELLLGDLAKVQPGPVYDSSRKLEESQRAALEAEQISITIYDQLRAQREQLERVSETLHETDANVSHSNRLLNNMIRRAQANRAVTMAILAGLGSLVLIAIYIKLT